MNEITGLGLAQTNMVEDNWLQGTRVTRELSHTNFDPPTLPQQKSLQSTNHLFRTTK